MTQIIEFAAHGVVGALKCRDKKTAIRMILELYELVGIWNDIAENSLWAKNKPAYYERLYLIRLLLFSHPLSHLLFQLILDDRIAIRAISKYWFNELVIDPRQGGPSWRGEGEFPWVWKDQQWPIARLNLQEQELLNDLDDYFENPNKEFLMDDIIHTNEEVASRIRIWVESITH